jgi:hypothetical protein
MALTKAVILPVLLLVEVMIIYQILLAIWMTAHPHQPVKAWSNWLIVQLGLAIVLGAAIIALSVSLYRHAARKEV